MLETTIFSMSDLSHFNKELVNKKMQLCGK